MTLREKINEDMKTAMKARETEKLGAIRLLHAELKQKEVDERIVHTDDLMLNIIEQIRNQRTDSKARIQNGTKTQ